ncbi:MAG: hypothetical protein HGA49_08960 [Eubacteriaceae bacterium]|nr:hypothetical protein [Eubacteriaceae bacterium]
MATVYVKPGVCGLNTKITAKKKDLDEDSYIIELHIESESDNIKRLAEVLTEVDGMEEVFTNFAKSGIYKLGSQCGLHVACPVPSGIIKAIEVECGLALPKDVEMTITRD